MMFNGLNSIDYINLQNVKDNNQLNSALSQFLNDITDHNIIICQNQEIINNENAIISCEYNNYIIVKYDLETKYDKFQNDYRNEISYIINGNKILKITDSFTIQANNSIEIHYASPAKSLNNLFSCDNDLNSNNIISVNLTHLDSSLVENTGYMFYNCAKLKSLDLSKFST